MEHRLQMEFRLKVKQRLQIEHRLPIEFKLQMEHRLKMMEHRLAMEHRLKMIKHRLQMEHRLKMIDLSGSSTCMTVSNTNPKEQKQHTWCRCERSTSMHQMMICSAWTLWNISQTRGAAALGCFSASQRS